MTKYSMVTKNGYDIKLYRIKDGYRLMTEMHSGGVAEIGRVYHGDDGSQEWFDGAINSFCKYADERKK